MASTMQRIHPFAPVTSTIALALVSALLPGCTQRLVPSRARPGGRDVSLRYEGSCAHLACCSRFAQAVPAQTLGSFQCEPQGASSCSDKRGWFTPAFTCDPYHAQRYRQPEDPPYLGCDDQQRWLSLPGLSHSDCGERYLVCYRGVRVLAVARDRSAQNESGNAHYEGSLGLLRAIGADAEQRETIVSIYALHERDRIASDPHCVGSPP
jgi:hypothetical protein